MRSKSRCLGAGGLVAIAILVLGMAVPASAQLSSISATKNAGNSANLDNADADVFSNVVVQSSGATTFTTRYSGIALGDVLVGNITPTLNADYNVSFQVTTPGDYRVTVTESLLGGFSILDDTIIVPLSATADITAITGTVNAGPAVSSGSLNVADAGSRNTGGSASFNVNNGAGATILGTSAGAAQTHTLRFTWTMTANSSADEAAVKIGIGSSQGGQTVGGSPGNAATDGHFVTVTVTPLCGNGVIDAGAGEQCDTAIGGSACCTNNCRFASAATTCRGVAGVCDVAELCTGGAATCPADGFASAATPCRAGTGFCDPTENCTGAGVNCPADVVTPGGTICNAGSGDLCDPDEACTGIAGQGCPADSVAPNTTTCRTGSGDLCDPDETCTGIADQACPADVVSSPSTVCRTGSGDLCDPDETCTGNVGDACPADTVSSGGTVCRAGSGDLCDPQEVCSGSVGDPCPGDIVTPGGTICNPGSGDLCDTDEACTGNAGDACPGDTVAPNSTVCRP
ncbi:MAG TPA: hypothetical protein VGR62_04135, partial [Candidatus Binatia bacterium]|nr:hypothetical protein [Candidatus Binatia bacterium]